MSPVSPLSPLSPASTFLNYPPPLPWSVNVPFGPEPTPLFGFFNSNTQTYTYAQKPLYFSLMRNLMASLRLGCYSNMTTSTS